MVAFCCHHAESKNLLLYGLHSPRTCVFQKAEEGSDRRGVGVGRAQ